MTHLVPGLFERQALATPDAIAVSSAGEDISYRELNVRANKLAHWLRSRDIGPERIVAVLLPRGAGVVTAMLGVLKCGGAYLPCDPSLPAARLKYMLRSAGAQLLITDPAALPATPGLGAEVLDIGRPGEWPGDDPVPTASPASLAYVIFTSGSTGEPKPVAVEHRSLANHLAAVTKCYALRGDDRVLQYASAGFDVAAEEIFPTLGCGGRVVVLPDPAIVPAELERFLAEHQVTVVNLPSPAWHQWTADLGESPRELPDCLRLLVVGSDRGQTSTLAAWRKHSAIPVINAYGLTETTITATMARFGPENLPDTTVLPVGRPIRGATAHVLDSQLREVPPGATGELYIGGLPLARGYHDRPALTAQRFVPDPLGYGRGGRLHRTGDLARITGGQIELLGRADGQVKIRGYRVETGEVAHVLATHRHVASCHVAAVGVTEPGETTLVAYLAPGDPRFVPSAADLRGFLAARLPGYMIPSAFVIVDALPMTPAGKVDTAALRAFEPGPRRPLPASEAPRTAAEHAIAGVWQEILRTDRVGIDDDIFELGGHSLTMMRIAARLKTKAGIDVPVRELADHPTIRSLARRANSGAPASEAFPLVNVDPRASRAPLTFQQEQVWFLAKLVPESIAYHAQTTIRIVGPLDADILDRVVTEISRRHAILRTTFEEFDGVPCQVVHRPGPVRAQRVELAEPALEGFVQELLHIPFDLSVLPLVRWTLVKLGDGEHELVLVEHHLVHDGWSFALLMRELTELYRAFAAGNPSPLADPAIQYGDYARWQRDVLGSPAMTRQLAYWSRRLGDPPPPLALPYDRPRPKVQTFGGQTLRVELPARLPGELRAFCRVERTTLFTAMYAAFAVLLNRYTGEPDIAMGSAFANRQQAQTHDLLGMLVNAVVLRCDVRGSASFRQITRQCHEVVLEAVDHQELPFGELVRAINPDRDLTRNPLTQILFSANDSPLPELDLGGARGTIFERGNDSSKMDLDVVVIPRAESSLEGAADSRILLMWEYNVDLFDEATMRQMIAGYLRLLEAAVADPDLPVRDLPLLSDEERRRVLTGWNPPGPDTRLSPVHLDVMAVARRTPDAVAVVDGEDSVSYAELADRAGRVAAVLRRHGAGPGRIVGICLPRSISLVVAELGVLLAGAAYLPMDPDNPPGRLDFMITDAHAVCTITTEALRGRLPESAPAVLIGQTASAAPVAGQSVSPSDAAYAIYTSGSTGRPKGVIIQHSSLANLVRWRREAYEIRPQDRMTMFASPGFDPTVSDIWPTLAAGASVHVPDPQIRMLPHGLARWMLAERITMAELPTPLAESLMLLPWPEPCPLRLLIAGGDRLHLRPAAGLPFLLSNEYGPTENTATSTWEVVAEDEPRSSPPIGRPITGTAAYVLDEQLQPVPPGAVGELYLGGSGVGLGYLGRPGLTAGRFVPDPFARVPGSRLYRTGDQARHLPDGRLEFIGRVDAQVKLRGFRIEPAEIMAALRGHPAIADAYVTSDGDRLIGYLVAAGDAKPDPGQLRAFLASDLPRYMVPTAFVYLSALPVSAAGKVDRRRLPPPGRASDDAEPPSTDTEQHLARIWREVLGVDTVGVTDSFFDLGGHSLLLGQVHYRLANEMGLDLTMVTLFEHPTIRSLAVHLDGGDGDGTADGEVRGRVRADARGLVRRRRALIRPEETR